MSVIERKGKAMKLGRIAGMLFLTVALPAAAAEVTVSAAVSLSDAFREIAAQYQKQYSGAKIRLNTAASGVLLQQAAKGAPVDLLAFADGETMDAAAAKNLIVPATRRIFARNTLVLAAPAGSRLVVKNLGDLQQAGVRRIAAGNPDSVPAGRYARSALRQAGVWDAVSPKIIPTQNVRQALDYVARGETDVGFVYRTDVLRRRDKVGVLWAAPASDRSVGYPLAVARGSRQPAEAKRFADYVLSAKGRAVFDKYGFAKP